MGDGSMCAKGDELLVFNCLLFFGIINVRDDGNDGEVDLVSKCQRVPLKLPSNQNVVVVTRHEGRRGRNSN